MKASLILDQSYLSELLLVLKKAKKKIDILSFSFAIGSAGGKIDKKGSPYEIAQALVDLKKKKNLKVRFFTEGLRETSDRNAVTAEFLATHGVEVMYGSTHAKGFSVDDRYVLFGSTNLTNQSIKKNHEANLLIDDRKATKEFQRYFEHLWNGGGHGGIELKKPFLADGDFKDALIDIIDKAKKRIEFSIYFFNQKDIEKALIRAQERGVKITGLIHQHYSFAMSYIYANKRTLKKLNESGIEDLHLGVPSLFSHSKYLVADRKEVILGTGNWLDQDVNIHPQLYIKLSDPILAKGLAKHVATQIKRSTLSSASH
jgi:phosphatidylserine/phosphatidylglycerophosphate/cardiolipin synthase-like enzyme